MHGGCAAHMAAGHGGEAVPVEAQPPAFVEEVSRLAAEFADLRAMVVAQNALLERLVRRQEGQRVSRQQEAQLKGALRARAEQIALREGLPVRLVAEAIRKSLRELTGRRAVGDVPAGMYDRAIALVRGWYMPGALRRIRRETEKTTYPPSLRDGPPSQASWEG